MIAIDTFLVQNLLVPFCYVLGKDTLRHFPLLDDLEKPFQNFSHTSRKSKIKKFQQDSSILASSEADGGN